MSKWTAFLLAIFANVCLVAAADIPRDWVDPDTGHRIIRLSDVDGSRTLYFHDNSYTPDGDKLIFNTPKGVAVLDISQLGAAPPQMKIIAQGTNAIMARRTREVYVRQPAAAGEIGGLVYAVNIDTGA